MTKNIFNQGLYNENKNASFEDVVSNQETEKTKLGNYKVTNFKNCKRNCLESLDRTYSVRRI